MNATKELTNVNEHINNLIRRITRLEQTLEECPLEHLADREAKLKKLREELKSFRNFS